MKTINLMKSCLIFSVTLIFTFGCSTKDNEEHLSTKVNGSILNVSNQDIPFGSTLIVGVLHLGKENLTDEFVNRFDIPFALGRYSWNKEDKSFTSLVDLKGLREKIMTANDSLPKSAIKNTKRILDTSIKSVTGRNNKDFEAIKKNIEISFYLVSQNRDSLYTPPLEFNSPDSEVEEIINELSKSFNKKNNLLFNSKTHNKAPLLRNSKAGNFSSKSELLAPSDYTVQQANINNKTFQIDPVESFNFSINHLFPTVEDIEKSLFLSFKTRIQLNKLYLYRVDKEDKKEYDIAFAKKNLLSFRYFHNRFYKTNQYHDLKDFESPAKAYIFALKKALEEIEEYKIREAYRWDNPKIFNYRSHKFHTSKNEPLIEELSKNLSFARKYFFTILSKVSWWKHSKMKINMLEMLIATLKKNEKDSSFTKKICKDFAKTLELSRVYVEDISRLYPDTLRNIFQKCSSEEHYFSKLAYDTLISSNNKKQVEINVSPIIFRLDMKSSPNQMAKSFSIFKAHEQRIGLEYLGSRFQFDSTILSFKAYEYESPEYFDHRSFDLFSRKIQKERQSTYIEMVYSSIAEFNEYFDYLQVHDIPSYSLLKAARIINPPPRGENGHTHALYTRPGGLDSYLEKMSPSQIVKLFNDTRFAIAKTPSLLDDGFHSQLILTLIKDYKLEIFTKGFKKLTSDDFPIFILMASLRNYSHHDLLNYSTKALLRSDIVHLWKKLSQKRFFKNVSIGTSQWGPIIGKFCYAGLCKYRGSREARRWMALFQDLAVSLEKSSMGPRGHKFVRRLSFLDGATKRDSLKLRKSYYKDVLYSETKDSDIIIKSTLEINLTKQEISFIKENAQKVITTTQEDIGNLVKREKKTAIGTDKTSITETRDFMTSFANIKPHNHNAKLVELAKGSSTHKAYLIKSPRFPIISKYRGKLSRELYPISGPIKGVCALYGLENMKNMKFSHPYFYEEKTVTINPNGRFIKYSSDASSYSDVYCVPKHSSIIEAKSARGRVRDDRLGRLNSVYYQIIAPRIIQNGKRYKISRKSDLKQVCALFGINNSNLVSIKTSSILKSNKVIIDQDGSLKMKSEKSEVLKELNCFKDIEVNTAITSSAIELNGDGSVHIYQPNMLWKNEIRPIASSDVGVCSLFGYQTVVDSTLNTAPSLVAFFIDSLGKRVNARIRNQRTFQRVTCRNKR